MHLASMKVNIYNTYFVSNILVDTLGRRENKDTTSSGKSTSKKASSMTASVLIEIKQMLSSLIKLSVLLMSLSSVCTQDSSEEEEQEESSDSSFLSSAFVPKSWDEHEVLSHSLSGVLSVARCGVCEDSML